MTRILQLAFFVSVGAAVALLLPACVGGYQAPAQQQPQPSMQPAPTPSMAPAPAPSIAPTPTMPPAPSPSPTPVPAPSTAQPLFDANVAPIIMADCSNAGCHGGTGTSPPKFAAIAPPNLYSNILNYADILFGGNFDKTQAQILTKIAAGHNAVVYTAAQQTSISNWLDAEYAARYGTAGTVSPRDALLIKWSGCMTLTDWETGNVGQAWGTKRTDTTNTACQQCHINGQGWLADGTNDGTNAANDRIFNILTTQKNPTKGGYMMEDYFTVDDTDPANLKMAINTDLLTMASTGYAQHEKWTFDDDNNGNTSTDPANPTAMQRLQTFFTATQAKLTAGTCAAPTLTP